MKRTVLYILLISYINTTTCIINCYVCSNNSCHRSNELQASSCPTNCCYSIATKAAKFGITHSRGCTHDCKRFCADQLLQTSLQGKSLLYCRSCSENHCNDDDLSATVTCYKCTDCPGVTPATNVVSCSDGCYINEADVIVRGCSDVCRTNGTCKACYSDHCNGQVYTVNVEDGKLFVRTERSELFNKSDINGVATQLFNETTSDDVDTLLFYMDESNDTQIINMAKSDDVAKKLFNMTKSNEMVTKSFNKSKSIEKATTLFNMVESDDVDRKSETNNIATTSVNIAVSDDVARKSFNRLETNDEATKLSNIAKNNDIDIKSFKQPESNNKTTQLFNIATKSFDITDDMAIKAEINITGSKLLNTADSNDATSIMCYTCTDCNVVDADTAKETCSAANCCYKYVIGDSVTRGCNSNDCENTCSGLMKSNDEIAICLTCADDETDYCNGIEYHSMNISINCYSCTNCNTVNETTPSVKCPNSACCYKIVIKTNETSYVNRGCKCEDTCSEKSKSDNVAFCMTCNGDDGDWCNHNDFHPKPLKPDFVMCYTCTNCNRIYPATTVVKCKAGCCYKAVFKDHAYDSFYVSRGCADDCVNTCDTVRSTHLQEFPQGYLYVCMTCNEHEVDRCNGNEYYPPRGDTDEIIECYDCRNCNVVNRTTKVVKCKGPACCYKAVVRNRPDEVEFVIRGCADVKNCYDACTSVQNKHLLWYPDGEFIVCMTCSYFAYDRCNLNDYHPAKSSKLIKTSSSIMCYDCNHCDVVSNTTHTTKCSEARCCYTAVVNDGVYGAAYIIRGCVETWACYDVCGFIKMTFKKEQPNGQVISCNLCRTDGLDYCNKHQLPPHSLIRFSKTIECYSCHHCNIVYSKTNTTRCNPDCCYNAIVRDELNEVMYAIRGCAVIQKDETCLDACKAAKREYLLTRPNGNMNFCLSCGLLDSDRCNRNSYMDDNKKLAGDDLKQPFVFCYDCHNCYNLTKQTSLIKCNGSCYNAVIEGYVTVRGCAGLRSCEQIKSDYLIEHPVESFDLCETCMGDRCNVKSNYLKQSKPEYIQCYECRHCNEINHTTTTVKCSSAKCCYIAGVKDHEDETMYTIRGCLTLEAITGETCENACAILTKTHQLTHPDGSLDYCMSCSEYERDYCNSNEVKSELLKSEPIKCYKCRHCNEINNTTPTVNCASATCCYKAGVRDHKNEAVYTIRGCLTLEAIAGETCENAYDILTTTHQFAYPDGSLQYCVLCDEYESDYCNNNTPKILKHPKLEPIKCYECWYCNEINTTTPTINCPSAKCCYKAGVKDHNDGSVYTIRGCLKLDAITGETCDNTCAILTKSHQLAHPDGSLHYCMSCNKYARDYCNSNEYLKTYKPEPIKCYNCTHCNEINDTTPSINCPSAKCCYQADIKDHNDQPVYTIRGCLILAAITGETCENTCVIVKKSQSNSSVHHCKSCNDYERDYCNSNDVNVENLKQPTPSYIRCYECRHCNKINAKTPIVKCHSTNCCYKAGVKDHSEESVFVIRGCLTLEDNTGETCENTCAILTKTHRLAYPDGSVQYCMSCNEHERDYCNSNQYHPMKSVKTISVSCYKCDNCNYIVRKTGLTTCHHADCCYHAVLNKRPQEMLYSIRGCYVLKEGQGCEDTCMYLQVAHEKDYPDGSWSLCMTCSQFDGDNCNRNDYHPSQTMPKKLQPKPLSVACFSCSNCDTVTAGINQVQCRDSDCCYKAIVKDHEGDSFYSVRGCYDVVGNVACEATCEQFRKDRIGDEVFYCDFCREERDGCNGNEYNWVKNSFLTPTTCYNCKFCDVVTKDTDVVTCPIRTCCYMAVVSDSDDGYNYTIRGCVDTDISCKDACGHVKRMHLKEYTDGGSVAFCMTCREHDSHRCNKNDFNPMSDDGDVVGFKCYECRHCDTVTTDTPTVLCRSPECCYRAVVNDVNNEPNFAIRGCALLEPGETCAEACLYIRRSHVINYPRGSFHDCTSCTKDQTNKCNNEEYSNEPPVTPPPVLCYNCRNCNVVNKLTPTTFCAQPECCYNAVVRTNATGMLYTIRGCKLLRFGEICNDTCHLLEADEAEWTPAGDIATCLTCNKLATHKCNHNDFQPYLLGPIDSKTYFITCYECRHCDTVNNFTNTVVCAEPECCYRAIVTDKSDESGFTVRGCVSIPHGETCANACAIAERNHLKEHPGTTFRACMTCTAYESDDCNKNDFTATELVQDLVFCYTCNECDVVTNTTKVVRCVSKCCYSAVLQLNDGSFITDRNCANEDSECHRYCVDVKESHSKSHPKGTMKNCELCSTNRCNKRIIVLHSHVLLSTLPEWPVDEGVVKCYNCKECYGHIGDSKLGVCVSKCCYTLISTVKAITKAERKCVHANDTYRCMDYCVHRVRKIESVNKKNIVHVCKGCSTNNCNNEIYYKPRIEIAGVLKVSCYECRDCETVDDNTLKVDCASGCCFATLVQIDTGEYVVERRCAKSPPGLRCDKKCRLARQDHLLQYPTGRLFDCVMCDSNLCNNNRLLTPEATGLEGEEVNCYSCVGCYTVHRDTVMKKCPTECCYTILWTEFSGTNVARLCSERDCSRRPCPHITEIIVKQDNRSVIHNCSSCKTNKCNSISLIKPKYVKIHCYHCNDCTVVTADTHIIYCPTECCYTALFQKGEDMFTKRKCARTLGPNRNCTSYCLTVRENRPEGSEMMDCETCTNDRCNHHQIHMPKITKAPVMSHKCYECVGCYKFTNQTVVDFCEDKCCYAKVQTGEVGTASLRGCAKLTKGQSCDDYCPNLFTAYTNKDLHDCHTCHKTKCNTWTMHRLINCYECNDCSNVTTKTPLTKCPTNCCYTALYKRADETYTNMRRCAKYVQNLPCSHYCVHAAKEIPDSNLSGCYVCSMDKCNNLHMTIPERAPAEGPFRCYTCVGCYSISRETVVRECPSKCCYSSIWTEFNSTNVHRGCAVLNDTATCNDFCTKIKYNQPDAAIQCSTCNTRLCNDKKLVKKISCYEWYDDVNITARVIVTCEYTDCCFSTAAKVIAVTRSGGRSKYTAWGCGKSYLPCDRECVDVARRQNVWQKSIVDCQVCSTNLCNNRTFDNVNKTLPILLNESAAIDCYNCKDCYMIDGDDDDRIKLTRCTSKCCYGGNGERKCIETTTCDTYCGVKSDCRTCSNVDKCNSWNLLIPTGAINCYACVGCYSITDSAATVACPDKCCSVSVWTEFEGTNIVRRCVNLNGTKCDDYCEHRLGTDIVSIDPHGMVHSCRVCSYNKCNDWLTRDPTEIVEPFYCYSCVGCYDVDNETITEECPKKCCQTTKWIEFGGVNIVRKCVAKLHGQTCQSYCQTYNDKIHVRDTQATIYTCNMCEHNLCNGQSIDPKTISDSLTEQPNDNLVNIDNSTNFKCYDCYGCYSVSPTIPRYNCTNNCCYTVLWTQFDETQLARRCANLKGTPCNDYCTILKADLKKDDPRGMIHECKTCNISVCNTDVLGSTEAPTFQTVSCYDCFGCYSISTDTPTISCKSKCCYAVYWTEHGVKHMARRCSSKLNEECSGICDKLRTNLRRSDRKGEMHDCKHCTEPNCNNIEVHTNMTKCYQCNSCNRLKATTPTIYCASGCCYTAKWTTTNRGCARTSHCITYCKHIKPATDKCYTCTADKCNSKSLKPRPAMTCYDCYNCYTITANTPTIDCETRCCYSIKWTTLGTTQAVRRCAKHYSHDCEQACPQMRATIETDEPDSMVHHCKSCASQNCNKLPIGTKNRRH